MELVDGLNVMFGNPNDRCVESQPYILIVGRDTVENLREEAERNRVKDTAPKAAPSFHMDTTIKDFYQFTHNSFSLEGYDPHPFDVKIPVAV